MTICLSDSSSIIRRITKSFKRNHKLNSTRILNHKQKLNGFNHFSAFINYFT